ncbi:helix-turn-helix domain-containing protein [Comamonas sp. CMM03]|uniref:helix-turn-helix domain-containing protein n=1 Tax=Comamonas sp. CMM03 TaxID=2854781 RepID=UPI001C45B5BD|nr:helix-turn-helix transcriptional regulator [Comamonas sp. CMM03]MBV7417988.1 helix-turn-helix domain-containing protein [Comamonas sp. CMM03]
MTDNFSNPYGERIKSERLRLDIQQLAFAEACGVSRGGLLKWEKGEASPNAAALAAMSALGVDVLYVVTGQRAGDVETTLAPAERELLQAWRQSSEQGRALLSAAVDVLKPV